MMASGQLDVSELISKQFDFSDAESAYKALTTDPAALGILLRYSGEDVDPAARTISLSGGMAFRPTEPVVGFIGAGNYASRVLIPAFNRAGARLHTIVTSGGQSGVVHGTRGGFAAASSDVESLLSNVAVEAIAIVTRHDSHAELVARSLAANKHVFVEKPLAIDRKGMELVAGALEDIGKRGQSLHLMVGFNRRFSPHIARMKSLLDSLKEPKAFVITVNAGAIPAEHWTQNRSVGGGRIIGEACHFIDLMRFLAGSPIISVQARRMGEAPGVQVCEDKAVITLGFADGSFGTVNYLANGASSFPKERVEVFASGRVLQLDNFRKLKGFGWSGFRRMNLWRQDKGQAACATAFVQSLAHGEPTPIPIDEVIEVARVSIEVAELLQQQ